MSSGRPKKSKAMKQSDNEEMSSEEPKLHQIKSSTKSRSHHKSKKGKKRGDSYSSDGTHPKRDKKAGKHLRGDIEEEELEDEYDDEDSYNSEEDPSEDASFIAPEEEVERELQQEREWKEQEYRKERKQRDQPSKKKNVKGVLDSEDEEIIKENIGIHVSEKKKKRRLKKNIDAEVNSDIKDEGMQDNQVHFGVKREEEDPNAVMFHHSRKTQFQDERALYLQEQQQREIMNEQIPPVSLSENQGMDYGYERRNYYTTSIFKDANQLKEQLRSKVVTQRKEPGEDEQMHEEGLEEMFDGQEIDDQYATKQDEFIANIDVPERLQILIGNRFDPDEEEIREEANWIFERLEQEKISSFQNQQSVKEKIFNVLILFRNQKLDIPMIIKYRRFMYAAELDENDVQLIFNLDQEYGKFKQKRDQIQKFLMKIEQFDESVKVYQSELALMKNQYDLDFFSPLITFLKSYYQEELLTVEDDDYKKKNPVKFDKIQNARKFKLDKFAQFFVLRPTLFIENLQHRKLVNKPPENLSVIPFHQAKKFLCDAYPEEIKIFSSVCEDAHLTTSPTDKGNKELDVFHPSYRVKRINKRPLSDFHPRHRDMRARSDTQAQDLFLDIIQCEKNGLITVNIQIEKDIIERFYVDLGQHFMSNYDDTQDQWNIMRKEIMRRMYEYVLYPEMIKEARTELQEVAENFIIKQAQEKYKDLLMTGPFECLDYHQQQKFDEPQFGPGKSKGKRQEEEVVKDRPRYCVMGVILQQIDYNNHMVTVAVVDKYGELLAHKDLMHLMPPRGIKQQAEQDEEKKKKIQLTVKEEQKEHEADKKKIADLMVKYSVDLVVVGANRLDARKIKEVFKKIAEWVKSGEYNDENEDENLQRRSKGKQQIDLVRKEAIVIWGSMEVPKLFASSHKSMKLLKNCSQNLKQAVSLARYEQDPMCEILNLWSSVPSENQTLSINLHPLQKLINQAKFSQSLEEINIQCVNKVGIDLNILVDRDHMSCLLQFIGGLGPRKAKKLLKSLNGRKIFSRKELLNEQLLSKNCFMSAIGFIKIRVPQDEKQQSPQDYLDLTRIHSESYITARKIACDAIYPDSSDNIGENEKLLTPKDVIRNPDLLKNLDIKQMRIELKQGGQQNMISIVDIIIEEFKFPFKDPRIYRNINQKLNEYQLLYWLIDETERTFKRGIIVTATVVRVLEKKILCKLDNGIDGIIMKEDIGSSESEKLEDFINHVITGRIDKIKIEENQEGKFSVYLKCRREDLERHDKFVDDKSKYPEDDLKNHNFQIEKRQQAQSRYINRRINHPKFKNTTSNKAIAELQDKEIGEFLFRPSSKGTDNINLTWKFYTNNIVHIDIVERDKPPGASIGNKLQINEEDYDNLQEIYERYILPCNRALREVSNHPKFVNCSNEGEFATILKAEKSQDPSKIPYRFTILSEYPQHVVIGYIARNDKIDKEFIKVKPRGFYFHEKYHKPFQTLINWYKENFRSRDYQKLKQKYDKRPPIVKQPMPNVVEPKKSPRPQAQMDWQPKGGDSVHSMNDERRDSSTPYQIKTENYGRNTEVIGGSSRTGAMTGAQFSEYNSNIQPQMSENFGRGRSQTQCFNCQEYGHMSKDCTQQKKQTSYGRGVSRNTIENRRKSDNEGGWNQDQEELKQDAGAWDNQNDQDQRRNSPANFGGWGQQDNDGGFGSNRNNQSENKFSQGGDNFQSGWGQKTPSRNDYAAGGNDWGNDGPKDDNSPARSQRSQETYGRGRGRSRGQGGGGGKTCYKCDREGHMARECPNQTNDERPARQGGDDKVCFKCSKAGHFARECPNQGGGFRGRGRGRGGQDGGGRTCFKCQREGHFAKECPNDPVERGERPPPKRQRRDNNNNGGGSQRWENENDFGGGGFNQQQEQQETWGGGGNPSSWDTAAQHRDGEDQVQEGGGWGNN